MGSEDFYPEERPVHRVSVDGFWMDEKPVTAAQFRRFVRETKYVTLAERPLDAASYPDADPELLVPGSLVFRSTSGPVDLNDHRNWWEYVPGAYWKRPGGKGTTINGRDTHPVVHIAYEDAEAYAAWAGKELPTEAEWELRRPGRARRGGLRMGRRALPRRQGDGEHVAGRVPLAEPGARRLRGHLARRQLRAERLRPLRHDRERVGVDVRLVHARATRRGREPVLRPAKPTGHVARELEPARRSRAASSRAARTCVRRTTASATDRRRARARRSTRRRRTSAFAASCAIDELPRDPRVYTVTSTRR